MSRVPLGSLVINPKVVDLEIIELFANIPANSGIYYTYVPPEGYAFIGEQIRSGTVFWHALQITGLADDYLYLPNVDLSKVWETPVDISNVIAKNRLHGVVWNTDTSSAHDVDMVWFGWITPKTNLIR